MAYQMTGLTKGLLLIVGLGLVGSIGWNFVLKDKLKNGKKPTEANVRAIINAGGNGMPAYADMLADDEKANLIAYLKTL